MNSECIYLRPLFYWKLRQPLSASDSDWVNSRCSRYSLSSLHYLASNSNKPATIQFSLLLFKCSFPVVPSVALFSSQCLVSVAKGSQGCKWYVLISHLSLTPVLPGASAPLKRHSSVWTTCSVNPVWVSWNASSRWWIGSSLSTGWNLQEMCKAPLR